MRDIVWLVKLNGRKKYLTDDQCELEKRKGSDLKKIRRLDV